MGSDLATIAHAAGCSTDSVRHALRRHGEWTEHFYKITPATHATLRLPPFVPTHRQVESPITRALALRFACVMAVPEPYWPKPPRGFRTRPSGDVTKAAVDRTLQARREYEAAWEAKWPGERLRFPDCMSSTPAECHE